MRGNHSEAQGFATVDEIFKEAKEPVINRSMDRAKPLRWAILLQLSKPVKDSVHEDEIGISGIDAGRENGVEAKMAKPEIAQAAETVGKYPKEKGEEMGRGQARNAMPEDVLVRSCRVIVERSYSQICDAL
jgi:hypothetical protein